MGLAGLEINFAAHVTMTCTPSDSFALCKVWSCTESVLFLRKNGSVFKSGPYNRQHRVRVRSNPRENWKTCYRWKVLRWDPFERSLLPVGLEKLQKRIQRLLSRWVIKKTRWVLFMAALRRVQPGLLCLLLPPHPQSLGRILVGGFRVRLAAGCWLRLSSQLPP